MLALELWIVGWELQVVALAGGELGERRGPALRRLDDKPTRHRCSTSDPGQPGPVVLREVRGNAVRPTEPRTRSATARSQEEAAWPDGRRDHPRSAVVADPGRPRRDRPGHGHADRRRLRPANAGPDRRIRRTGDRCP